MRWTPALLVLLALLAGAPAAPVAAQPAGGHYNQDRVGELLYAHRDSLDDVPEVTWRAHVLAHPYDNSILARGDLFREVGDGDYYRGKERLAIVQFLNRVWMDDLRIGDTIALPSHFDVDPRAYAPFPRRYAGAEGFDKLFVIHKSVQAWAAYENGRLERWGLVNTGAAGSPTPTGRFNFNWQEVDRISTLSPPGERWRMRYVFNFHDERGIHVHQYRLPNGAPGSHGCVRLIMDDAKWIYGWAEPWRTSNGSGARGLPSRGRILRQGTTVLVLGEDPVGGPPARFEWADGQPSLIVVDLPEDPYSVRPGTPQQVEFDRKRRQS